MVDETPAAGWRPDPVERHALRYWNGSQWTVHVADDGATAVDLLTWSELQRERRATNEERGSAARKAYQGFPDLPGTHAEWRRTTGDRWSLDLVTRDGDVLASDRHRGYSRRITVGERVFVERHEGRRLFTSRLREVVDLETGASIFRIEGCHSYHQAKMVIHLPDERRYSFPVEGGTVNSAVMTAADETETAVAQMRRVMIPSPRLGKWHSHPKHEVVVVGGDELLTRELLCVIAVARLELPHYVTAPSGGG